MGWCGAERLARRGSAQGGSMNDRDRLEQLRALLVRLERMPASAARDRILSEVRARAVDVETGERPAAMRAVPEDGAEPEIPEAPPKRKPRPAPRRPVARAPWGALCVKPAPPASCPSPAPARRREVRESVVDLLEQGGVLCLDDQLPADEEKSRRWSGGLRG